MKARTIYNKNGNQNKKEAAAGAGVTESILSNIENDDIDRDVGCSHVIALANYYGVTTDYLLGISDIPQIDVDLKNACEYLGLSANAVEAIHYEFDNVMKRILSDLITSENFGSVLTKLLCIELNSSYADSCAQGALERISADKQTPHYFDAIIQWEMKSSDVFDILRLSIFELSEVMLDLCRELYSVDDVKKRLEASIYEMRKIREATT